MTEKKDIKEKFKLEDENLLNPDLYIHKLIEMILEIPKNDTTGFILNIDLLEGFMLASDKITPEKLKEITQAVEADLDKLTEKEILKDISDKMLLTMKYNRRFKGLLKEIFAGRPKQGPLKV